MLCRTLLLSCTSYTCGLMVHFHISEVAPLYGTNSSTVEPVAMLLLLSATLVVVFVAAVCNGMTSFDQQVALLPSSQYDFFSYNIKNDTNIILKNMIW